MKSRARLLLLFFLLSLLIGSCTTTLTGYSPRWENGSLREELPFPVTDVHRAAVSALVENEFTVLEDKTVLGSLTIQSVTINGEPLQIVIQSLKEEDIEKISPELRTVLEKESGFLTAITIRVGTRGNRERSLKVLESVHSYLH